MSKLSEVIRDRFNGKKILLLGFGREGQSSYRLLREIFPGQQLTIADANPAIRTNPLLADDPCLDLITGEGYLESLSGFDLVLRSPGIVVWPYVSNAGGEQTATGAKMGISPAIITSQTDLFLQAYRQQVIGVTGTKGKSTTSSLIHHILCTAGRDSVLAGNIGNPVFHLAGRMKPETIAVCECSSHQLEFLTAGPAVAVFLNLFQEHLDAYPSYSAYQQAKLNMVRYQSAGDVLVYHEEDALVSNLVSPFTNERRTLGYRLEGACNPGCFIRDGWIWFNDGEGGHAVWQIHQDRFLRGAHNLKNIMAAIAVARSLHVDADAIEDGIGSFKGLEHRLEYVGEYRRIHFYNDSIATIPEACIEAVRALPGVETLVAGGFDRGIDYSGLAAFLATSGVRTLILVGAAGRRIGRELENARPVGIRFFYINRFDDFAPIAFRETAPGRICLLSPAAASYDEFNNFEERGKRFRALVRE